MNSPACVVPVPMGASKPLFDDLPDVLTVEEIASILRLSEQTIRREMRVGNIPAIRCGRSLRCSKTKFIEYVEGIQ